MFEQIIELMKDTVPPSISIPIPIPIISASLITINIYPAVGVDESNDEFPNGNTTMVGYTYEDEDGSKWYTRGVRYK